MSMEFGSERSVRVGEIDLGLILLIIALLMVLVCCVGVSIYAFCLRNNERIIVVNA